MTVTDAKPVTLPTAAVMEFGNAPGLAAAVKKPPWVMVPAAPCAVHVKPVGTTLLNASRASAVNCWVPFAITVAVDGVTVTDSTGPGVTLTDAKAVSPFASARTVLGKVPAVVPAVKTPVEVMVPPPATTLHVGVTCTVAPPESRPLAENAAVAPACSWVAVGIMISCESAPIMMVTVAVPETEPTVAVTAAE